MTDAKRASAEAVAIAGLAHLASDDDLMMRFCSVTGILANDIRQAAGDPGFLAGVLDFYMGHEPDLMAFAETQNLAPEAIVEARNTLSPPVETSL